MTKEEFADALGADVVSPTSCKECGGMIYLKKNPATGRPTNTWLHLYQTDWKSNPHNAEPVEVS